MCVEHGGGNRCQHPGCTKSAQSGDGIEGMCVEHGGGNRCQHCTRTAKRRDGDPRWLCVDHAIAAGLLEATKAGVSRAQSRFFDDWRAKTGEDVPWRVKLRKGLDPIGNEKPGLLPEHPAMKPDGFVPPRQGNLHRGTVFQFHGNHFHGWPPWHEDHESHVVGGRWGPDAFEETWEKMQRYHDAGYVVKYIWECDYERACGKCPVPLKSVVHTFPERP